MNKNPLKELNTEETLRNSLGTKFKVYPEEYDKIKGLSEEIKNTIKSSVRSPISDFLLPIHNPIEKMLKSKPDDINKIIVIEECSELTKTITKDLRDKGNRKDILEEMIDSIIGCQMVASIYKFTTKEILTEYNLKMLRNFRRKRNDEMNEIKYDDRGFKLVDEKYTKLMILIVPLDKSFDVDDLLDIKSIDPNGYLAAITEFTKRGLLKNKDKITYDVLGLDSNEFYELTKLHKDNIFLHTSVFLNVKELNGDYARLSLSNLSGYTHGTNDSYSYKPYEYPFILVDIMKESE